MEGRFDLTEDLVKSLADSPWLASLFTELRTKHMRVIEGALQALDDNKSALTTMQAFYKLYEEFPEMVPAGEGSAADYPVLADWVSTAGLRNFQVWLATMLEIEKNKAWLQEQAVLRSIHHLYFAVGRGWRQFTESELLELRTEAILSRTVYSAKTVYLSAFFSALQVAVVEVYALEVYAKR